jgi:hypothetical protein
VIFTSNQLDNMSDSGEDAAVIPSNTAIESALRSAVRDASKQGEEVTIKSTRTRVETKLGLDAGFFKNDDFWKERSKELIEAAFNEPDSPEAPKKVVPKPKAGAKRKSDDVGQSGTKRRKKSPVLDSEEDEDNVKDGVPSDAIAGSDEDNESEADVPSKSKAQSKDTSALSSPPETEEEPALLKQDGKSSAPAQQDSESELSSVIDEPQPKKKGRKPKSDAPKTKTKAQKPTKPTKELSPDEEEIKRLQGYLLKCGIRKLWHRELAGCSTSKEKIKHLKGMLEDVGMTGRFSAEKARQIKEQRELKAELESAREFNEKWGHEEDDEDGEEESEGKKRGRLKPKGLIDFGDDDGDDSD